MNELVSLRLANAVEQSACIVDGTLALSTMGLILSLRLTRERRIWLPRALWPLLDNDEFYQNRPDLIGGPGDGKVHARMLAEWRRAWLQANLLDRFWWIGDARHESRLPDGVDDCSVDQFELLSQAFEERCEGLVGDGVTPLSECARDAIVLSAVLGTQAPVILTVPAAGKAPPILCRLLKSAGVKCKQVEDETGFSIPGKGAVQTSMWFAAQQLGFLGLRVAAVHLAAPRAVVMHRDAGGESWSGDTPLESDPWEDARATWHMIG